MSPKLRVVDAPVEVALTEQPPVEHVPPARRFTRTIQTAAALPWRQRQMAELEARLGAPAPMEQLVFQVRRTDPWRPRAPGLFEAEYLHASGGAAQNRRATSFLGLDASRRTPFGLSLPALVLVGLALVVLPAAALNQAWSRRQDQAEALSDLDTRVLVEGRRATAAARRAEEARRLDQLHVDELSPGQVLKDLDWLSLHKRPDVTLSAVHWARGIAALEVASDVSPLDAADKPIQCAPHPLRPGVWLWGVALSPGGRTR